MKPRKCIASLGGAAAVICSRTRTAALPTDRPTDMQCDGLASWRGMRIACDAPPLLHPARRTLRGFLAFCLWPPQSHSWLEPLFATVAASTWQRAGPVARSCGELLYGLGGRSSLARELMFNEARKHPRLRAGSVVQSETRPIDRAVATANPPIRLSPRRISAPARTSIRRRWQGRAPQILPPEHLPQRGLERGPRW
jgi:hypothetical protein